MPRHFWTSFGDRELAGKFLSVINSEADRMTRLVKDLLQLSGSTTIK